MNKKFRTGLGVLALCVSLVACSGNGGITGSTPGSGTNVAKVNDTYISESDYQAKFETLRKMVYGSYPEDQLDSAVQGGLSTRQQLGQQVRNDMVKTELLKQALEENNLEITDEAFNEEKAQFIESMGGEEGYQNQLQATGLTDEEMDSMIRDLLLETTLQDWYFEEHAKSQEEVQAYYDENKEALVTYDVSHILVETIEEAEEVMERIDSGDDFAELAREFSLDTSAENGGNLGEVTMTTSFVPEFLEAMSQLGEGEVSDPVQSQFGYHIIKVNSLNDDIDDLEEDIQANLLSQDFQNYLSDLYAQSNIELYYPATDVPDRTQSETESEEVLQEDSSIEEVEEETDTE